VWSRQATITNDEAIANNSLRSMVKVAYYQAFALVYGFCGAFAGAPARLRRGCFGRGGSVKLRSGRARRALGFWEPYLAAPPTWPFAQLDGRQGSL
jgi:hypothetical protein